MKILYFGSACDNDWYNEISKNKAMPYFVAQYLFEMALIKGLIDLEKINMKIYYLFQEQYYPRGKFLIFKYRNREIYKNNIVSYLASINIPIIKEFFNFLQGFFFTFLWAFKNRNEKNKIIFTPFNYTPLSFGILIASKIFRIKRVNVFTDLSSDIINKKRQNEMMWIKRIILPFYLKLVHFIETNYDIYILFTNEMNAIVNTKNKPYMVMEGIFNNELDLSEVDKYKAILYAGTLSFEYGIKYILDAFEAIDNDELQMWLFGDGDMKDYIKDLCIRDERVKYFGFKSHDEVFKYEKMASLLINIRNPEDEYTKYSFPSKTFEYMVSATPFLTTKLKGIPIEYYNYLYTIDDYDAQSVKNKIEDIISKPQIELNNFGLEARKFILETKNPNVQALKIINMLNQEIN